jgi:hypothetical protein
MRCRIIIVVGCIALAGCAPRAWTRGGATQADYNKDSYSCERDVQQAEHLGGGISGAFNARDMYARCMQAAGWAEAPRGQGFETVTPP